MYEKILIVDFGSQFTQLIARRIRELNVYCEIHPFNHLPQIESSIKGVILSGSPFSVVDKNAPTLDLSIFNNLPILGICYGAQLLTHLNQGIVEKSIHREYGGSFLSEIIENTLLKGISENAKIWMSHGDSIINLPEHFKVLAKTINIPVAAFQIKNKNIFGIQFHPEVTQTECGKQLLKNFVLTICNINNNWTPSHFVDDTIEMIKTKVGNQKVVMGLSGGVDSSVASFLIHRAIKENLYCIFIDNGLLRKNEFEEVLHSYQESGLNVLGVDAKKEFYDALKDTTDPEEKRKKIGRVFIEIFDKEAHKIENVKWLGQGTIYPDVIESVSVAGPSATIKSHHNVGGLPEKMNLKLLEPLRSLFKDEVRKVGETIGVPQNILKRHPFPGPGLGIRILGEVNAERVKILQEVDKIFIDSLKKNNLYDTIWQALAVLLPIQSVGVMGDERTYENVVALRAINSIDGMTAEVSDLPYKFLTEISTKIINNVKGVNRVVYDISSKPPATIEWE